MIASAFRPLAFAAVVVVASAASAGCRHDGESLVVVQLRTMNPVPVHSVEVSVENVTRVFAVDSLSASQRSVGVYVSLTGLVHVVVTGQGGSPCLIYRGATTANIPSPGDTVTVPVTLDVTGPCVTDGGDTDAAGTGGAPGATGGATGSGGAGAGGNGAGGAGVPTLSCTEYSHNADPSAVCLQATDPGGPANNPVVTDVAFSNDSKYLFTAGSDGRVKVWRWNGTSVVADGTVLASGGAGTASYLALSRDGQLIAAGAGAGHATIWNTVDWSLAAALTGIPATADVYGIAFGPDSRTLYTIDSSAVLSTFNETSVARASTRQLATSTFVLASSPRAADGTYYLGLGYMNGTASLINVGTTGTLGAEMPFTVATNGGYTWTLHFSADGRTIAAGSADGRFGLWAVPITSQSPIPPALALTSNWIGDTAFSPSGTDLAVAAGGSTASRQAGIWSLTTGAQNARVTNLLYRPTSIAYTTEGNAIAIGEHECGKFLICAVP